MTTKNQFDATREPPVNDPERAEYKPDEAKRPRRLRLRDRDANEQRPAKDHVYGVASRARWGDNDISELHRESRASDNAEAAEAANSEQEEEEEEESSASDLTVAQLREALEAAEVEIPAGAKKADLVALYEEHDLGDAE